MEKKIKLYKFNELEKEIQDKLVEKEKELEYESFCEWQLEDLMEEESKDLLKQYFNNATFNKVYYDLSYSQGCGSMIEFTINIEDINNKYHILTNEELRYIQDKGIINEIKIYHNDNLYYHEYTFSIDYYDNFGYWDYEDIKEEYNIKEEDFNNLENKIINFLSDYNKHDTESQFIKDIINMNRELTKRGYNLLEDDDYFTRCSYDYLENISEDLYFKNGDIYKGDYE